MVMELIQQQVPDIGANIQRGFEFGQKARANELAMLAAKQEIDQKNQLQTLYKLAATGNPQAAKQLSMVAPQAYEGLQKYQTYRVQRGAQLANSVLAVPEPLRAQRYQEIISEIEKEFGEKPQIPGEWSKGENGAEGYLKNIVAQARQVEDVAKEQYEAPKFQAELANIKARTASEYLQQNKTRFETEKLGEEINIIKDERKAASQSGLTPSGFKAQQQELGKVRGEKLALLNSTNSKLPQLLNTVNKLSELGQKATYTFAGLATDFVKREFGMNSREASVARAAYISTVDNQILPLLRDTFGSAFTQKEGESLKVTLGDPNKSPAEKDAVLESFIQQKVATLNSFAQEVGINPINPTIITKGKYSLVGGQLLQEGQTATNPKTGEKRTFRGGEWQ